MQHILEPQFGMSLGPERLGDRLRESSTAGAPPRGSLIDRIVESLREHRGKQ